MNQQDIGRCGSLKSIILLLCLSFAFSSVKAQTPQKETEKPKDVKIIKETNDGKGNTIRVVQYSQGGMRITETIIVPKRNFDLQRPLNPDTINKDSVVVVVDKSHYCVRVLYKKAIVRRYKAVFGPKPLENKCMEGDRCTPEGWFKIASKNGNSKYDKFMALNYPNDSDIIRFNKLKKRGAIPQSAKIGGSIGIHGIWRGGDDMIEMGIGWTDGCIALKNKDIEELFKIVGVGTRVYIRK